MYRQDGNTFDVHDGALLAWACHLAGIAIERRQADAALQAAAERLHATFGQAAIGIAIADLDGRLLEFNDKFVDLLGYNAAELRDLRLLDVTHPEDVAQTAHCLQQLLAGTIPEYKLEKRYIQKAGSVVWSHTTVSTLKDEHGQPQQLIAAVENITNRKQVEQDLRQRETELRALADSMPQLVWMADRDGDIFWYNRGWYEYTGTTAKDMENWGWQRVHDPAVLPLVLERWRHALDSGVPFEMEFPLRGADGSYRPFLTRANPIHDEHGQLVRWFGTNTDLASIDRSRQMLIDETRVLDLVNTTGRALVSQLDLEALVQQVTDAATQLSGARFGAFFYNVVSEDGEIMNLFTLSGAPREAFGQFGHPRATALFGPTFHGDPSIRIDDVLADPRYGQMAPHHGMPKGHPPVRSYLSVPVVSRSGEVIGGLFFGHPDVGVFTERTERIITGIAAQAAVAIDNARLYDAVKRGNDERERLLAAEKVARAQAEQASVMKDEFLSTLSHELRTPLSSILGWSQVLQGGRAAPDIVARGIDAIARNARAQARLVEDLLDMSRIVSGKVRLDLQPTNLQPVVDAAIEAIQPSADAKGIRIGKMVDPGAGVIAADAARLQQVVWNLLSNAVKFTPAGGRLDIRVARVEADVQISVSDSGEGISAEFLPFVFDRFRQADSSIDRAHGGLGIGLAITRQLTELHGGSVHVQSAGEGQGATFTVRLPAIDQHGGADASSAHSDPRAQVDLAGISALVVDDDADTREVIRHLLLQARVQVITADSVAQALACIRTQRPDVIVSDIGMPEADGYVFMHRLRQLPVAGGGQVPVIALTAFAGAQDRAKALQAGFQAHIAKPFDADDLLATVARLVGRAITR